MEAADELFPDVRTFNSAKLFSPRHYPQDRADLATQSHEFLDRLIARYCNEGGDLGVVPALDADGCRSEVDHFVIALLTACSKNASLHEAWNVFSGEAQYHHTFPNMLKLWQAVLVLPVNTACCERGFSKQNQIKAVKRNRLGVQNLAALMRVSLSSLSSCSDLDWEEVFQRCHVAKDRRAGKLSIVIFKLY